MKVLVAVLFLLLSVNSLAEEKGSGEKFQKAKSMMLEKIEKRISNLQDVKSCVSSASNKEALKSCREKMKAHRAEMKEQRKDWKKKRKERRKKRKDSEEE